MFVIISEVFSAIIRVSAFKFALEIYGITEASTALIFLSPWI